MQPIRIVFIFLLLVSFSASFGQKATNKQPLILGEQLKVSSSVLNENRTVNIYLPPSYQDSVNKEYPVIYLLDGGLDEDFLHIVGITQFHSFPWIQLIEESIVVGIENVDRKRDFTYPSKEEIDQKEFPTSGHSQKFIEFIETELITTIEKEYRTTSSKTLIGQSLGGLLATQILFHHSHLFDDYIIVSPSLWWDAERLLTQNIEPFTSKKNIYVAVGDEGEIMIRTARELFEKVKKETENKAISYRYYPSKNHGDALHIAVYEAFENFNN